MAEKEYIERGALLKQKRYISLDRYETECVIDVDKVIDAPAADVAPVVHGEWVKVGVGITERIVCSACNSSKGYFGRPPFCNQCGAKMDSWKEQT